MKTNPDTQPATPALWANNEDWIEPVKKVPVWVKPFMVDTPAQFLEKYIPREKLEAIAGAMYGIVDLEIPIPEWAKKASCQFWKNYIENGPLRPRESVEDFGVMFVMLEKFTQGHFIQPQEVTLSSKLEKFISGIAKKIYSILRDKIVSNLSHAEKAQFYTGCARGEEIIVRMQNPDHLKMVKRATLYIVIAVAWRQFEKFPSHAAAERWLRSEKIIGDEEKFSSREIYAVFEVVGLPAAPVGRPRNPETRRGEIVGS